MSETPTDPRLVITPEQTEFTGPQVAELRRQGMTEASKIDLGVFFRYAQTYGLDPFTGGLYMVGRHGQQQIQTDIEGVRKIAQTEAATAGVELVAGPVTYTDGNEWFDQWPPGPRAGDTPPTACQVVVIAGGIEHVGVAALSEYTATNPDDSWTEDWTREPVRWVTNIAEALALRSAFPSALGIVKLTEEVTAADRYDPGRTGKDYGKLRTTGAGKK